MPNASNTYMARGSMSSASQVEPREELDQTDLGTSSKDDDGKGPISPKDTLDLNETSLAVDDEAVAEETEHVPVKRDYLQLGLTLALGQLLSLCILCTGITSSYLADYGVDLPQFQGVLTYLTLAVVWTPVALFYGEGWRGMRFRMGNWGWLKYLILAFIDVEANFMVVKAYQYASITSVQLLDNFVVPCVMVLSIVFLNVTYRLWHYVGAMVAVAGIISLVVHDYFKYGDSPAENPVLGDLLVIASAILYAVSNISQEFLVKGDVPVAEWVSMLSLFGVVIATIQFFIIEGVDSVQAVTWDNDVYWQFAGFVASMLVFYSLVPVMIRRSSSTVLNLSLLTADFYSVFAGIFLFDVIFTWIYALCFVLSVAGLMIYNMVSEPVVKGPRKIMKRALGSKQQKSESATEVEVVDR
ncbi:hypothetical protein SARC_03106 [Sphaeroforma arctica JP610]|uniref:EamA domain-containing protein n=1 Tax=Sphaeroforma arctica JP610 TaxID=667725 RepID=A0A0L0G6N4_9EUKA|nr:hypothetical protein SARC_03106 [Sphaeroforma arctica JP610]KNC84672.1 hypothetical protein SARC_03106 [Sphaeroforma arctica JP610]|eukprot:XP_014158574.1 hypothetical protein SARC_03106 [Sphaeroforma arctica JP610]